MIKKGIGRQPDNICCLILTILSKNKACDCYVDLILIDLSKKKIAIVIVTSFVIAASKKLHLFVSIFARMVFQLSILGSRVISLCSPPGVSSVSLSPSE